MRGKIQPLPPGDGYVPLHLFKKSDLGRESLGMSGRAKRVLVYTASLLIAPMPVMPFAKGEPEYVWAIMVCGAVLSLSSFYVVQGERKFKNLSLLGKKLLVVSLMTLLFGVSLFVGSLIYLVRG